MEGGAFWNRAYAQWRLMEGYAYWNKTYVTWALNGRGPLKERLLLERTDGAKSNHYREPRVYIRNFTVLSWCLVAQPEIAGQKTNSTPLVSQPDAPRIMIGC